MDINLYLVECDVNIEKTAECFISSLSITLEF